MKTILTIAGSDSSGGAGIQQDLRTITSLHQYAATAITAITSQNTLGVQAIMPVPQATLASQLHSVLSDLTIDAVKIGMIPDLQCAQAIVAAIATLSCPIVYDPVMVSTSGTRLMDAECLDYICTHLFPLCTLITPNIPEYDIIATHNFASHSSTAMLIKGGHADSALMTDRLLMPDGATLTFSSPRITSSHLHGTGCCLSSAIATFLACGDSLPQAVAKGKDVVTRAIKRAKDISIGRGNGPVLTE